MAQQIKTFRITSAADEDTVNGFLQHKRVHHLEASYSGDPSLGVWNMLVVFEDAERRVERPQRNDQRNDQRRSDQPRPVIAKVEHAPPDIPQALMPMYENIRKWRNQIARDEKVKPYILFNNKQLEDLVKAPPAGIDALKTITADMSQDLFDKYGNQLLGLVSAATPANS